MANSIWACERCGKYTLIKSRRNGFIIFVPPISQLDQLYALLKSMGIKELGASSMESVAAPQGNVTSNTPVTQPRVSASSGKSVKKAAGSGLADFFKSKGLEVIDKRANGGCLWVVGSQEQLEPYLVKVKELYGVTGGFASGRATK